MACEAHFALSCGTELRGCAEDCIRCVLEPVLEEELEKGKEKKKKRDQSENDENLLIRSH